MESNTKLARFDCSRSNGLYPTVSGKDVMDEKHQMNNDGFMKVELWFDETRYIVVSAFFQVWTCFET